MTSRLDSLWQDIRFGTRRLLDSPSFSAAAVVTLALGIGANTAMFSVLYGALLKPLPFDEPERLVSVYNTRPNVGQTRSMIAPAQYFTYREDSRVFDDVAVWTTRETTLTGVGAAEDVPALLVTDGFLPMLRVRPVLGRPFSPEDDAPGGAGRVIITYGCWQKRFGGDPHVLDRQLTLDGVSQQILGVLPRTFKFMDTTPDVIVPLRFNRAATTIQDFSYYGLARLKGGVTPDLANRDVARMIALVPQRFAMAEGLGPTWFQDAKYGPDVRLLSEDASGGIGNVLWVLMGTIGMVLLIACANVANLFLVRTEGRRQEMAVRAALGAGRGRLVRTLLSESVMLGLLGGAVGVALAAVAVRLVRVTAPETLPRVSDIALDPVVVAFAALLSVVAGLLFGLVPALRFMSPRLAALREGGRTVSDGRQRHRTRSALVVSEIALSLVLLIASALMIRTFQALRQVDPGFTRGREVLTAGIWIPPGLAPTGEPVLRKHQEITRAIERIPGVQSVGLGSETIGNPLLVEDAPLSEGQAPPGRRMRWVLPGYFETRGTRLLAGRHLTWRDVYGYAPVVVIDERLARELWRTPAVALGKRVRESAASPWREVIGVVGEERANGLAQDPPPLVYYPSMIGSFLGRPSPAKRYMVYHVRSTRVGSPSFVKEIQEAVWSVDRTLPLSRVRTLDEMMATTVASTSFALVMLAIAAAVSLLLGVGGIYGVLAYVTTQRSREIGIRMALGAVPGDVTRLFLRHGLWLAGTGVALGVGVAFALSRLMKSMLFGVTATDPLTYAGVSIGLVAVAILAVYVPSRRAAKTDPVVSLRAV
jgi:putative ABC transport system permease protein